MRSSLLTSAILSLLTVICCQGCGSSNKNNNHTTKDDGSATEFPYTNAPLYITDPVDELLYLSEHFWDKYIRNAQKDTSLVSIGKDEFKKAYSTYIQMLGSVESLNRTEPDRVGDAAKKIIETSHKKIFAIADSLYLAGYRRPLLGLIELSETFLYNPNSPYLNEELYIPAVESILALKSIDSLHKMQYHYQQKMVMLNRKGKKANDFKYEYMVDGNSARGYSSLHRTKAEYLLIYFNNPGCASCKEIQNALAETPAVNDLVENGRLKILSMYIDKDVTAWMERHESTPSNWIYARDHLNQFETNELYGIRAIPSIYLLNNNKEVILKDAGTGEVIEYFNRIIGKNHTAVDN